jgi:hypothetical protein
LTGPFALSILNLTRSRQLIIKEGGNRRRPAIFKHKITAREIAVWIYAQDIGQPPHGSGQLHSHEPVQKLQWYPSGQGRQSQALTLLFCATKTPAVIKHNTASFKISFLLNLNMVFSPFLGL